MTIAGICFLIGMIFECGANLIGLRTYFPSDPFHSLILIFLLGLEIGGATSIVWSISSVIYKKPEKWKIKLLIWGGIIICISVIFPLIAGG